MKVSMHLCDFLNWETYLHKRSGSNPSTPSSDENCIIFKYMISYSKVAKFIDIEKKIQSGIT